MTTGEKIKRIRNLKGMKQSELGNKAGFGETGGVRLAQYETGNRHPKQSTIARIAKALSVPPQAIYSELLSEWDRQKDILFQLDELNQIELVSIGNEIVIKNKFFDVFLSDWYTKKNELQEGKITENEYFEWQLSSFSQ